MDLIKLFHTAKDVATFAPGQVIFEYGSIGHEMYVVLDGQVEIQIHNRVIYTAKPGEIVGIMALIDDLPRSATAIAKDPCRLAPVDEKRFQFLVQQNPYFSIYVMKRLADWLRRMDERLNGES